MSSNPWLCSKNDILLVSSKYPTHITVTNASKAIKFLKGITISELSFIFVGIFIPVQFHAKPSCLYEICMKYAGYVGKSEGVWETGDFIKKH